MSYSGLVAVHLGAGYHAPHKENDYKKLIEEVCQSAMKVVKEKGTAVDGVCEAMRLLENSPKTNAGIGSNLTICGKIECDASVMDGSSLGFGSVGAISGVKNPILVAKKLLFQQQKGLLGLGRIPPCILAGQGAKTFAIENDCELISEEQQVTKDSRNIYLTAKRHLEEEELNIKMACKKSRPSTNDISTDATKDYRLDTVGAIAIDSKGNVASAVSSGGLIIKHSGRIGQAACFGAGVWAQRIENVSIGVTTSGVGEYLILTNFAQQCAKNLIEMEDPLLAAKKALINDFKQSPFLKSREPKSAGALMLVFDSQNDCCELIEAHTTSSFCFGYLTGKSKKAVMKISRLTNEEVHIEAQSFKLA